MSVGLTVRDAEILRTLMRVQLATTNTVYLAFFTGVRHARKRLGQLGERGLVARHRRGLPGPVTTTSGLFWRLTSGGVQAVSEVFPRERIPDNLVERVSSASLRNHEHRDAIGRLYVALVGDRDRDAGEVRRRADRIDWQGEYDVQVAYQEANGARLVSRRVVPDATLTTHRARLFVELDRSTESRARCRRALLAYDRCVKTGRYEATFGDTRTPWVVYVTRSERRADSLRALAAALARPAIRVAVLPFDDAAAWLRQAALGDDEELPAPPATRLERAESHLRAMYGALRDELARRQAAGEAITAPACMAEAYAFMQEGES